MVNKKNSGAVASRALAASPRREAAPDCRAARAPPAPPAPPPSLSDRAVKSRGRVSRPQAPTSPRAAGDAPAERALHAPAARALHVPAARALHAHASKKLDVPPQSQGRGPWGSLKSSAPTFNTGSQRRLFTELFLSSRTGQKEEEDADDVIDLGAPRVVRRPQPKALRGPRPRRPLLPSSHLDPRSAPQANPKVTPKQVKNQRPISRHRENRRSDSRRTAKRGSGEKQGRRRKRAFRRLIPNSRLYRPPPRRPAPPPATPNVKWAPLPAVAPASFDTASHAALHLSEQRHNLHLKPIPEPVSPPPSSRLIVTLPSSSTVPLQRYRPTSTHFRLRTLDTDSGESTPVAGRIRARDSTPPAMESGNRQSTSPDDYSEGNETLSAPSEFLAEFLSAIMRRQYAEALKYCRLILQYEPHNATARGFCPLLQHKVQALKRPDDKRPLGSSSEEMSTPSAPRSARHKQDVMEQGGDSSDGSEEEGGASRPSSRSGGSCCSQSSLEMDSSEALAHSSPSLSLSRRTEPTDSASGGGGGCDNGGGCDSVGSASRSDTDDNGNAPAPRRAPADLENDNAEPLSAAPLKNDSLGSLQRLRAQFTCSIK